METVKQKAEKAFDIMKGSFGYTNTLAAPRLVKVVVSTGTGSAMKRDNKRNDFVVERLARITGQKPSVKSAKKSIASFKIRQGDPVGVMVTLRGNTMHSFLEKLFNIAIPRTKDFRGIDTGIVDNMGNATIAIKEHTIFPETADEELKDVFGFGVTIVTTAQSKEEALQFLTLLGLPFKK